MIYFAILLLLCVLVCVYDYRRCERGRRFWVVAVVAVFVLLGGLRFRIGTDTINYIYDYVLKVPTLEHLSLRYFSDTRYAPGYVLLTSIFRTFTDDFTYVQIFHSLVVNSIIGWFFYKNSRHVFVCLLLYFWLSFPTLVFQQMRESLAVAMFLLAWPYFVRKEWLRWYPFILLAMSFHLSATVLLVLPLLTLPGLRGFFCYGKRALIAGLAVLLAGALIQTAFFKYIRLLELSEAITERAVSYSQSKEFTGSVFSSGSILGWLYNLLRYVVLPVAAVWCLLRMRKLRGEAVSARFRAMEFMTFLSIYIGVFSICVTICARFNNYFYLFAIVMMADWMFSLVPAAGKYVRVRGRYWYMLIALLFVSEFVNVYNVSLNRAGTLKVYMLYYPYASCIDQTRNPKREACFHYQKTLRIRR